MGGIRVIGKLGKGQAKKEANGGYLERYGKVYGVNEDFIWIRRGG